MASAKEIAKSLNLSTSTVSMVFNNKPGISTETRKLVLDAAKAMGYTHKAKPAPAMNSIALIVMENSIGNSEFEAPFFSRVIEGISTRAQERRYNLHIIYMRDIDSFKENLPSLTPPVCRGAILLASDISTTSLEILDMLEIPTVVLDNSCKQKALDTVSINNIHGIYAATEYLIELGHRSICFVGPSDIDMNNFKERELGFWWAIQSADADLDLKGSLIRCSNYHQNAIEELSSGVKALDSAPTGFVCANDWYAIDCVNTLHHLGYKVPDDVSVIGFDDISLSSVLSPKLTTMSVPKQRMGSLAVERLMELISGEPQGGNLKIEISPTLVIRESTGLPKK